MTAAHTLLHTFCAMNEGGFLILTYTGKTPSMAMCQMCELKFFLPIPFEGTSAGAEDHLRQKYADHRCKLTVAAKPLFRSFAEYSQRRD